MNLLVENWIAIAGVAAVLIVGIGGWYFLRPMGGSGTNQKQNVKGGTGIQSGRDTKL